MYDISVVGVSQALCVAIPRATFTCPPSCRAESSIVCTAFIHIEFVIGLACCGRIFVTLQITCDRSRLSWVRWLRRWRRGWGRRLGRFHRTTFTWTEYPKIDTVPWPVVGRRRRDDYDWSVRIQRQDRRRRWWRWEKNWDLTAVIATAPTATAAPTPTSAPIAFVTAVLIAIATSTLIDERRLRDAAT